MNIYIPKHIRKLGVVSKMCDLIEGYSVVYSPGSFDDYYEYLKSDPVERFIKFCIPESSWTGPEEYKSCISYLSRLFYSTKGTYQVLEYMKKYLDLRITDIKYTTKYLKLEISEVTLRDIDEKVFYDSLFDFLEALLYFENLDIKIGIINLMLGNTLRNNVSGCIVTYKSYTTTDHVS